MKLPRLLLILLCNIFFIVRNSGQCDPLIGPTSNCSTAPLLCLNQLCYTTSDTANVCCNNWCGNNTIINNPQYFLITPTQADVEIDIHVDDCTNGVGLQCALLDACPWDNTHVLDCDPGTPPGGTMILQTNGLIPGESYWLLIDGSNGAVCHYTISAAAGLESPTLPDSLDASLSYPGDSLVCAGYQNLTLFTGPDIEGVTYQWVLGWNGEIITSTAPTIIIQVDDGSPEGTWNVCVKALTGCDTTEQVCFPIIIGNTPTVIKDTSIVCDEAFPIQWHGQTITGPGDYTLTSTDEHLCSFDSTWTILAYPSFPHGVIDTFVCSPQFTYGGQIFDQTGDYLVVLPAQNVNGCDSLVDVHVTIGASDQFVEVACENNQMVLKTHITAQDETIDTVAFEWYTCSFDSLLSTAAAFVPDSNGCYSLIINSGMCRDTISSAYYNSGCILNDLCYFNTSPTCAGMSTLITPVFQVPDQNQIHWLIDFPGAPGTYYGDQDSILVTFPEAGTYPVSYTLMDSTGTWTCHSMMVVNTGPAVSLCCDVFTCDSCAFITLTNQSSDPASVNLTNGLVAGVFGNSMMNVIICSPEGFPTEVGIGSVQSDITGCEGSIVGDTFVTINPLPPALVFVVPIADTLCTYPNDLASYQWRYCDSTQILSTANCFVPPTSGCYCLEVANDVGCTYETCAPFFLSGTSPIAKEEIQLSPNPSHGLLQIKLPNAFSLPALWQLMDTQGKIMFRGNLTEAASELRLQPIAPGIYFLQFNFNGGGSITRKIAIEH